MVASERDAVPVDGYWSRVGAALLLLVVGDAVTTVIAAATLGPAAEANPVVRWALRKGLHTIAALNLVALVATVGLFYWLAHLFREARPRHRRRFRVLVDGFLVLLVAVGLFVVANNVIVILHGAARGSAG